MNDDLGSLSVRELIIRLADTEDTIRRTETFGHERAGPTHHPVNGRLIDLAQAEQRIIRELRRRENVVTPSVWGTEQPLAG